ncbi:MAG: MFS transporter [Alphaproteobacteria bacterium]
MDHRGPRLVVVFACLGHAYMHVLTALYLTVVLGLESDWRLSYDVLIRLWTVGSLMIGIGAPLAGWLGDRWSESRMIVAFFLITGGGAVAAGLAEGTTGLMLGLAALGLGASIYHPVAFSWVMRHSINRGRVMGTVGIFGSLGIAGAALIAATLTDVIDWRAAFILPGVVSVATGLVLWACIALRLVVDRDSDVKPDAPAGRGDAIRAFVVLSVTMVCGGLIFHSLQVAMPKWFDERMVGLTGDTMIGVGGMVAAVYLFASVSQIVGGHLCDRLPLKTVYVWGLALQFPFLALLSGLTDVPLLVAAALAVFIGGGLLPAENLLLARYTPDRHRGLVFGLKFILAFGVAPLAVQLVALSHGWRGDFGLLLWSLSVIGLTACAAALMLPGGVRRVAPAPAE